MKKIYFNGSNMEMNSYENKYGVVKQTKSTQQIQTRCIRLKYNLYAIINANSISFSQEKPSDIRIQQLHLNATQKLLNLIEDKIQLTKQEVREIMKYLQINQQSQHRILGGGCGTSKDFVMKSIEEVKLQSNVNRIDPKFMQRYNEYTNKESIMDNIENGRQFQYMSDIFNDCLYRYRVLISQDVQVYRIKVLDLIDVYLTYQLSGSFQQQDVTVQADIDEFAKQIERFKIYFQTQVNNTPCEDLAFYIAILHSLNSSRLGFDERMKQTYIKVYEFVMAVIKHGANIASVAVGIGNVVNAVSSIKETLQSLFSALQKISDAIDKAQKPLEDLVDQTINVYKSNQSNCLLKYLINVWMKKADQFEDNFWNIPLESELEFYINEFITLSQSQKNSDEDMILLNLIQINYLFDKITTYIEEGQNYHPRKEMPKQEKELQIAGKMDRFNKKLPNTHNKMKLFIDDLMQKGKKESFLKSFLSFTVKNRTFKFLAVSILLKYWSVLDRMNASTELKDDIMIYLSYQYLASKVKSVKIVFINNPDFVSYFNENIKDIHFKQRLIEASKKREQLLEGVENITDVEYTINSEKDIHTLIVEMLIQKWENDIKQRQLQNISDKDDILLEVLDLYITQNITYLKGNSLIANHIPNPIKNTPDLNITDSIRNKTDSIKDKSDSSKECIDQSKSDSIKDCDALHVIINNFLKQNYVYEKKEKEESLLVEMDCKWKVLGILAEGGTGKSMLMKKIETVLRENINTTEEDLQKANYIPLLIKCNSLDPINPSITDYLLDQGLKEEQIQNLKESQRNKVILLDGYDEYQGEQFRVYSKLKIDEWKNTLVIVTSRKEKLSLNDACSLFSLENHIGQRDETSYSIVKLGEFKEKDMIEYYQKYFKLSRTDNASNVNKSHYDKDIKLMEDCLKSHHLKQLLYLPINLYLFTKMIVDANNDDNENINMSEKDNNKNKGQLLFLKEKMISDQIEIQSIFFEEQFKREAKEFLSTSIKDMRDKKDGTLMRLLIDSYFLYFQQVAMQMFINKGQPNISNFLQLPKNQINYSLKGDITLRLKKYQQELLIKRIQNYINTKIITKIKQNNVNQQTLNNGQIIEFKHKSLFEFFVARAMKYDFDIHQENIYKLNINELKEFSINKKCIMNAGHNQSEQQVLLKFYKLLEKEINSAQFRSTYHNDQIDKNNRYIQYIKRSRIAQRTEISKIDIGSSNLLSALFISKFAYPYLDLASCSFSKAYIPYNKSDSINLDKCNLSHAYLKNSNLNFQTANTSNANFDAYRKVFEITDVYSFNREIWTSSNQLITLSQQGFINIFDITIKEIILFKSMQISTCQLDHISLHNNYIIVSSSSSLFLIDSKTFQVLQTYNFPAKVQNIASFQDRFIVSLDNEQNYQALIDFKFELLQITGHNCLHSPQLKAIMTSHKNKLSIWDLSKNFNLIKEIESTGKISCVSLSGDGKYIGIGHDDNDNDNNNNTCSIWNTSGDYQLIKTMEGHTNSINGVTFSADGKYFATCSSDKTCMIWSIDTNFNLIKTINHHSDSIHTVAFSPNNKFLTTGSDNKICNLWDVQSDFQFINTIEGHSSSIYQTIFSADGQILATCSGDKSIKIWNVSKGFALIHAIQGHSNVENEKISLDKSYEGHSDQIQSISFSKDGRHLASGSDDKTCKIWDVQENYKLLRTIEGHKSGVTSVQFSGNGKYLVTGSVDTLCKVWDVQNNYSLLHTIDGNKNLIKQVVFSNDSRFLASSSGGNTCIIWDSQADFKLLHQLEGHTRAIQAMAFSFDNRYLATASMDYTCRIFNVTQHLMHVMTLVGHQYSVNTVAFSPSNRYLATGSSDGTCKLWYVSNSFQLVNSIEGYSQSVLSVAFSPDGNYLATAFQESSLKIWNTDTIFETINTIDNHDLPIKFVTFSSDSKYLATCSDDNTCKIWNADNNFELVTSLSGHSMCVVSIAFSGNGKYLASSSEDKTCKIWSVEKDFELLKTMNDHTLIVHSLAFSQDSRYLATVSDDDTCKIYHADNQFHLITSFTPGGNGIYAVAFSPNGTYLATGSANKQCQIWSVTNDYKQIKTIKKHYDWVVSMAFSWDSKYLATGSLDRLCFVYSVENEFEVVKTIVGHQQSINQVVFTRDDKYLLTCSADSSIMIWNVQKDFELVNKIVGHKFQVTSICVSANGKYLASGSSDMTCKIWEGGKGLSVIEQVEEHINSIQCGVQSIDGKYIATLSNNICFIWKSLHHTISLAQNILLPFQNQHLQILSFLQDNSCLLVKHNHQFFQFEIASQKIIKEFKTNEFDQLLLLNTKTKYEQLQLSSISLFQNIFTI